MWTTLRRWLWSWGWGPSLPHTDLAVLAPVLPVEPAPAEEPLRGWSPALLEEEHRRAHVLVVTAAGAHSHWHCTRCGQGWQGKPQRTCLGVTRYTWATQAADLTSLTGLWAQGLQPRHGPCGYRRLSTGRVVWLYDRRDGVPHPPLTPHQRTLVAALPPPLTDATGHRCSLCGEPQATTSWRCARCRVALTHLALVQAALRTQRWAQGLLADPDWLLLRLIWRDEPAWGWSVDQGYHGQRGGLAVDAVGPRWAGAPR